jgi:hypothetical protein
VVELIELVLALDELMVLGAFTGDVAELVEEANQGLGGLFAGFGVTVVTPFSRLQALPWEMESGSMRRAMAGRMRSIEWAGGRGGC